MSPFLGTGTIVPIFQSSDTVPCHIKYFISTFLSSGPTSFNISNAIWSCRADLFLFTLVTLFFISSYLISSYCSPKNVTIYIISFSSRLYEYGFDLDLEKLYPRVEYPVSRETPMISPLLKWDHSKEWFVGYYSPGESIKSGERIFQLQPDDTHWAFVMGHVIDGNKCFHILWTFLC